MAYTDFADGKPVAADNGNDVIDDIRDNEAALRDGVQMGAMKGWNYSKTDGTGTAEEPQYIFYKKSVEWLRATLTWSGGNVTIAVWEYSANSGSTYSAIGTETISYDGSGNVVTTTWS